MARYTPELELRLIAPALTPQENDRLSFLDPYMDPRKRYRGLIEAYRPWESVAAKVRAGESGLILQIEDQYLPPAQRPGGEKMARGQVPGGPWQYVVGAWDARVPESVLFGMADSKYWTAGSFNQTEVAPNVSLTNWKRAESLWLE
ncbi:MAG: hypothetical protein ABID04_04010, partial [Patescibacteria group bacterium]